MMYLLGRFSFEEMQQLREHNEKGEGTFEQKLEKLWYLANTYGTMEELLDCLNDVAVP